MREIEDDGQKEKEYEGEHCTRRKSCTERCNGFFLTPEWNGYGVIRSEESHARNTQGKSVEVNERWKDGQGKTHLTGPCRLPISA